MTDQELIEAVAVEVMGAEKVHKRSSPIHYCAVTKAWWIQVGNDLEKFDLTNANHWMIIVERMRELGYVLKLGYGLTVQGILAWVKFTREDYKSYYHHKLPGHAVCLAALQAVREMK